MPGVRPMPEVPDKEDLTATWDFLEAGITRIMLDLEAGMDMTIYMNIYTAVHNFCTSQKAVTGGPNPQYMGMSGAHRGGANSPKRSYMEFSSQPGLAHLLGEDLYSNLISYLSAHLQQIKAKATTHSEEALLSFYIREWNRYTTAAKYINNLFQYLNRHWVKREMDEGKKNIYDVYTLHLVRWRVDLFSSVQENVMHAVLRMVEKQRNGEAIEQAQIKSIVDSFVSLGLDETDTSKSTLDVYRFHFERPFLDATTKYYQNESKQFVAENSVVEYMKKAEARLDEEKDRVGLYLHPDILSPLMKTCQTVLIAEHSSLLRDEFQILLDNNRQDDLARMYKLLSRIPDGLDPLRTKFEAHVRKAGLNAVSKVASEGESLEPKVYVDALLEVHTQYQSLVNQAFVGESEFVRSLDNACREFVNRNEVCKSGSTRSPELLAKYTDTLLKKSTKSTEESDLENMLTQIMTVFKYIEDKDVFQKFYSRMLAKRLVHTSSASDDAETSMISKLKEACGFEYTNKLQRMFQDIQISKDLNSAYKDFVDQVLDDEDLRKAVDTHFHILGTGFWPLSPPNTPFAPPEVIIKTYERFQKFYFEKHSGRKLTWLWNLCKGDLKANYIRGAKVPYTLQVSTYQMAILLLFNDSDVISYEEMEKTTCLTRDILDPSLGIIIKAKVLLAEPEGAKIEPGTSFRLNYDFKSKKIRVNLNIAVKSEQKQEVEDTHKTIEDDRKLLMQSAIVRIMKSRKKMKHVNLVQETISQITSRFTPKVSDIKKCIDILLEKEYLERLDGEELGYLA
ncbi:MAG: late secretory pathway protein avl9 [Chaenotheca gracillima]|nr:MAG: late secretory pathway protein avl9 [Chaenotheca gracillima]